jgi:proton glutamate symport protein
VTDSTRVLVALVAGLAGGAAIAASGNPALLAAADWLTPIGTIWVNAIRMTVIPLVVSLVITGVAGASDLKTIGRLGTRTLLTFIAMNAGVAAVMMPLITFTYSRMPALAVRPPLPAGAAEAASQVAASGEAVGLVPWLVSLLPVNPIAAAASGNMVSLILFTLLLAVAIARSAPGSRETLLAFFRALGDAMLVLVGWVIAAAPIGIFGLMLPLAAHGGAGVAGAVGAYIVIYSVACIAGVLLVYPAMVVFGRVPLSTFARAALPAQLIAFSSSSSVASLPALVGSAAELRMPASVTGFVLPLAVSVFKFAGPVSWTTGALFIGHFYGIPLGLPQLLTIAFAAVFLAFAAPGVPRGAFLMLTPLFLAIGLPAEGIGILIAADAFPDLFATVLNVTGDLGAAVLVARQDAGVQVAEANAPAAPLRQPT